MPPIIGVPTTRVSTALINRRLLTQVQYDQLQLFRVQNQISTGRRLSVLSDDAPAALRAVSIQSLIERKQYVLSSLVTNQSYLNASDAALGNVASQLTEVRATSLSVIGATATEAQRQAAIVQIERTIQQLLDTGNQRFRGRYLFSGSRTLEQPFQMVDGGIAYMGNDVHLLTYSDVDVLFESNISGHQVFGGFSHAVQGSVDLNPVLTPQTRLADLRGGRGIREGSVLVSNGVNTRVVSIKGARTIGDVARLLEAEPVGTSKVTARVTSRGLEISLDSGQLSIIEVGGGTTAAELGIYRVVGSGAPIVGQDLNPRLTLSTPLGDLLGTRAMGYVSSIGGGNDLVFEAGENGAQLNGVTIKYVDGSALQAGSGVTAGNEVVDFYSTAVAARAALTFSTTSATNNDILLTATEPGSGMNGVSVSLAARAADGLGVQVAYDGTGKAYSISVEAGVHSAADVVAAVQADAALGGAFTAALDTSLDAANDGSYVFLASDNNPFAGHTYNTGSDANTLVVQVAAGQTTANQVIAKVNAHGLFTARIDISERENDGNGFIFGWADDPTATTVTAGGSGETLDKSSGLRIVNGGKSYSVGFETAETVEDLLNTLNGLGASILAEINAAGTGINVRSRLSGVDIVIGENGGTTATQLGIRSLTTATPLVELDYGRGVPIVAGTDFIVTRKDGVEIHVDLAGGVAASALVDSPGGNNALRFRAVESGAGGNAWSVRIVDSGAGGGNALSLVGDVLTYSVDVAGGFTALDAIALLENDPVLSGQFAAQLDTAAESGNDGSGNLAASGAVQFSGGRGAAVTIGDVLALVNNDPTNIGSGAPVVARLATYGNGIELVSGGPPAAGTLSVRAVGLTEVARRLGLVPLDSNVSRPPTVGGVAAASFTLPGANNDFLISATASGELLNGVSVQFVDDGTPGNNSVSYDATMRTLVFDVAPAVTTVADLAALVQGTPSVAALFAVTPTPLDGGLPNNGTGALGVLPGATVLSGGSPDVLTGEDRNPIEVQGVFTALIRLRNALEANDQGEIERSIALLDDAAVGANFARAELGARLQALDVLQTRLEQEELDLRSTLSLEIDVDLVAAISELTARQTSFEAALKAAGLASQITLLDYL